ncbi:hypothetical protein FA13DRAFT_1780380 [Coprinellus micaceus]|uniref:Uncharacterized protein n=1 Tax=Coprinellus micaceus TaxID=71717 RepID=A0A4Y7SEB1_COPMI|nr:hypothetical protein FA13DRAFT_1780380 [Coprinellus micaceus]
MYARRDMTCISRQFGSIPLRLKLQYTRPKGNANHQKPLFPPTLEKTEGRPDPPLIRSYALITVEHSPRALILGFQQSDEDGGRTLFLKISDGSEAAYEDIGSPEMTLESAWDVFGTMAPVVAGLL